jgi:hypothetical protein
MFVQTDVRSSFIISHVDIYLNNTFIGSSRNAPYEFSFIPSQVGGVSSAVNDLRVTAYDAVGNNTSSSLNISFSSTTEMLAPAI